MRAVATTPEDAEWFGHQTSCYADTTYKGVKFLDDAGNLMAMVVYTDWTHNAVQMHIAIRNPRICANKLFLREIFDFPYRMGRRVAYSVVPADRERAIKLAAAVGFREQFRFKDGWAAGVDMVFSVMDLESCKWRSH